MRVLFLADRLSERGGADGHLLAVVEELVRAGVEVHLAVGQLECATSILRCDRPRGPCPDGPAVDGEAVGGRKPRGPSNKRSTVRRMVDRGRLHVLPGLQARQRVPLPLAKVVSEVRPDLLHLQNVMNPEALRWAASGRLPALVTHQDHRMFCPGRGKWTAAGERCREPMSRARCAACFDDAAYFDSIFTVTKERLAAVRRIPGLVLSHYMARELAAAGVPTAKLRCIPPFVHGLSTVPPAGQPCVLFAGRLVAAKGVTDAISIWRKAGTGLPLVIAGAGPERAQLRALDGLKLAGWVSRRDLSRLFARARALLLPSRWQEPFGIIGLEALALGVPVVAWRSGGIEEWHPGPLCEWGDLDGMAEALRLSVEKRHVPPPRLSLDKDVLLDQLLALYRELCA